MPADKITILVVDDSDIIRNYLRNFFSGYNFEVISCLNGLEGIQKAREYLPDLIFLDIMMPGVNGLEMLDVIRTDSKLKKIPVIIISGNTSKENVLAVIKAGADRVIKKPLEKEVIIKTITSLLGENFLPKTVEEPDKEFVYELCKLFLDEYPEKKQKIVESLEKKNKALLAMIIHELKGVGVPIGYPAITEICSNIEETLRGDNIDWNSLQAMCEEFFSIVASIDTTE